LPRLPLIGILFFTQVVNAILLVPLLPVMILIARDGELMGDYRNGRVGQALAYAAAALVGLSLVALVAAVAAWDPSELRNPEKAASRSGCDPMRRSLSRVKLS